MSTLKLFSSLLISVMLTSCLSGKGTRKSQTKKSTEVAQTTSGVTYAEPVMISTNFGLSNDFTHIFEQLEGYSSEFILKEKTNPRLGSILIDYRQGKITYSLNNQSPENYTENSRYTDNFEISFKHPTKGIFVYSFIMSFRLSFSGTVGNDGSVIYNIPEQGTRSLSLNTQNSYATTLALQEVTNGDQITGSISSTYNTQSPSSINYRYQSGKLLISMNENRIPANRVAISDQVKVVFSNGTRNLTYNISLVIDFNESAGKEIVDISLIAKPTNNILEFGEEMIFSKDQIFASNGGLQGDYQNDNLYDEQPRDVMIEFDSSSQNQTLRISPNADLTHADYYNDNFVLKVETSTHIYHIAINYVFTYSSNYEAITLPDQTFTLFSDQFPIRLNPEGLGEIDERLAITELRLSLSTSIMNSLLIESLTCEVSNNPNWHSSINATQNKKAFDIFAESQSGNIETDCQVKLTDHQERKNYNFKITFYLNFF